MMMTVYGVCVCESGGGVVVRARVVRDASSDSRQILYAKPNAKRGER